MCGSENSLARRRLLKLHATLPALDQVILLVDQALALRDVHLDTVVKTHIAHIHWTILPHATLQSALDTVVLGVLDFSVPVLETPELAVATVLHSHE